MDWNKAVQELLKTMHNKPHTSTDNQPHAHTPAHIMLTYCHLVHERELNIQHGYIKMHFSLQSAACTYTNPHKSIQTTWFMSESCTSSMDTSTCMPRPLFARWMSAAWVPIMAYKPAPTSPMETPTRVGGESSNPMNGGHTVVQTNTKIKPIQACRSTR